MTPENTPSTLSCPHCGYAGAQIGLRFCPNCGEALPPAGVRTTQIVVDQRVGQVQGGEVAGVKISQVAGNVFVGMDEEAQASATQNSASRIAHLRPKSGHTDSLPAAIAQNFILDKARLL